MKIMIAIVLVMLPALATAGTTCTTRKSGSVTITTCTDSKGGFSTHCRSYMSGSIRRTHCTR